MDFVVVKIGEILDIFRKRLRHRNGRQRPVGEVERDKKQNDAWTTGQAEMAWTNLDRPVRVFRFAQCEQASEGPKYHPTQKPLALMAWCLKWIKAPTVLDPFMGSGTTGVACAMHRRGFVGIERERKYFDMACERIAQAQAQGTLLPPEPAAEMVQEGLL